LDQNFSIPQLTPEKQERVRRALSEIDDSLTRKDAENDLVKEIVNVLHENTLLPKPLIKRIAKAYHKGTFVVERDMNETFHEVYTQVAMKGTENGDS